VSMGRSCNWLRSCSVASFVEISGCTATVLVRTTCTLVSWSLNPVTTERLANLLLYSGGPVFESQH
jgi:hypothetical protein